jgi:hypothetical protein
VRVAAYQKQRGNYRQQGFPCNSSAFHWAPLSPCSGNLCRCPADPLTNCPMMRVASPVAHHPNQTHTCLSTIPCRWTCWISIAQAVWKQKRNNPQIQ